MTDWRTVLRPVWGFIVLQPLMLGWFYLFSEDWVADYQALGWPLQVIGTVWLIPCYAYYEKYWDHKSL
jgi:hypothetical protein